MQKDDFQGVWQDTEVVTNDPTYRTNYGKIHYLQHLVRDHPLVIDTFIDRLHELEGGQAAMNCQLCKYREQALGYEDEVGAVQTGHHHHVRGIGTDHDHGHDHGHGHGHGHDHGHHHHPHD